MAHRGFRKCLSCLKGINPEKGDEQE